MKKIKLTQGAFALVDDEDFERLNQYNWHFSRYAIRWTKEVHSWCMHWDIIGKPDKGFEVDHINRNKLDNRRANLRVVTKSQNAFNRNKSESNISGFKGVSWQNIFKKWRASIVVDRKQIFLGYFTTPIEAHEAYCKANVKYHGEYGTTS